MTGEHRFYPGQPRLLRELLLQLQPHWRSDAALPARLEALLRRDRRCGSRDRRLYRELVYTTIRYLPWLEPLLAAPPGPLEKAVAWLAADTPGTRGFRQALAGDWPPCPPDIGAKAAQLAVDPDAVLPAWLRSECPEAFQPAQRDALLRRAPLWIRLQGSGAAATLAEFGRHGWTVRPSDLLPGAFALPPEADVTATEAYAEGLVEIQDLGSQLILAAIGLEPGGHWLDACAGAGGKALQLAALLGPAGRVDADDIRPAALVELAHRATRAGLRDRIACRPPGDTLYDGVLVDAPCSGSGTWRRSPHLKWTTTLAQVEACGRRQEALLRAGAGQVRPGGRLVYATCSLCQRENEAVIRHFLAARPDFAPAPFARAFRGEPRGDGLLFWPASHDGDGFFVASLRRHPDK